MRDNPSIAYSWGPEQLCAQCQAPGTGSVASHKSQVRGPGNGEEPLSRTVGEPGDSPPPASTPCPQVVAAMCTELCKLERVIWTLVTLVSSLLCRRLAVALRMPDTGSRPRTGLSHEPRGPPQRGMHVAHFQSVSRQPAVLGLPLDHLDWVMDQQGGRCSHP